MKEVKLNRFGTNEAIKAHIVPDMEKYGFRYVEGPDCWYMFKTLVDEITFNITIYCGEDNAVNIRILDECLGQPYGYQFQLKLKPKHPYALMIQKLVEDEMEVLKQAGILEGHERGEYI